MNRFLKKLLVILPVILLGLFYVRSHYTSFSHYAGTGRMTLLWLSFFLLYAWILFEIVRRKQNSLLDMGIQSSFFVYIFMVLTLTGYFILFREISVHNWYEKMMLRVNKKDHVNFELFKMFRIYKFSSMQILGNFIMLFPLGIYLPLLYHRITNFFVVLIICFLVSAVIELMQLITRYRSADVDDVLLNTLGACVGFIVYCLAVRPVRKKVSKAASLTS